MSKDLYIWLLTQEENKGYDTFDSCVVVAASEKEAKELHPKQSKKWGLSNIKYKEEWDTWIVKCRDYDRECRELNFFNCKKIEYWKEETLYDSGGWASSAKKVNAILLGKVGNDDLNSGDIICYSFNAG